jgi:hypothetical protein
MLSELQQHQIHQHELCGLNGVDSLCDLVEHQRVLQVRFHQHGFRVLQHLLPQELHWLNL